MPLISCLMLTYNQYPDWGFLLNEAVECFHRQLHAERELIIVNDTPLQTIEYSHPQVKVVNLPRRCPSLGEKANLAASLAQGEYLCRWDDDDIHFPWRLNYSLKKLLASQSAWWHSAEYWFGSAEHLTLEDCGSAPSKGLVTRQSFEAVGGYPPESFAEDVGLLSRLSSAGYKVTREPVGEKCYYLYRWGMGNYHLSGAGPGGYETRANHYVAPGVYTITPGLRHDYQGLTRLQLRTTHRDRRAGA